MLTAALLVVVFQNCSSQQVSDLTVNTSEHVNADQLQNFHRSVSPQRNVLKPQRNVLKPQRNVLKPQRTVLELSSAGLRVMQAVRGALKSIEK